MNRSLFRFGDSCTPLLRIDSSSRHLRTLGIFSMLVGAIPDHQSRLFPYRESSDWLGSAGWHHFLPHLLALCINFTCISHDQDQSTIHSPNFTDMKTSKHGSSSSSAFTFSCWDHRSFYLRLQFGFDELPAFSQIYRILTVRGFRITGEESNSVWLIQVLDIWS